MHPDMSKGHPRDNTRNVKRDDHVKQNQNAFSLCAIKWCGKSAQSVFHFGDEQLIDLGNGSRSPDQGDVEVKTAFAESSLVDGITLRVTILSCSSAIFYTHLDHREVGEFR